MPPKRLPSLRPTADLISFPLLKFSDATDHESEKTFSWKHTTLDLTAVFDTFQAGATSQVNRSSKVLKVVQGTKVLELLNVEQLSQDTIALTTETRRHSTQLHKDKLPLTGLIRCPLLALRYILPGGMVRRIQLKFLRDEDFRVAVSYLERLGCVLSQTPVSEKTARPERSGPSCSTIDRPMSGPSLSSSRPYIPPFSLPQHTDANFNLSSIPPASGQAVTHQPSLYPIPEHLPTSHHPISNAGGGDRLGDINWSSSTSRDRPATSSPYFAQPPATPPSTVSSSNISSERPSTAPLFSDENSILQLIPPRRELPFPRAAVGKKRNFDVATTQYASQSSDERMAVLDELFVSFIEDDNFITLCEDVSNCWRRIALGL
ncbi:hypothetical protein M501DRAFT_957828 [Patellaria atrata CBS 101060]|uniref:Uncharacterized protein n=1 Tax=Patellaria atrata CBS 101060 TaxID=1346257 RepID=A0A9P4S7D3_9PEZI|nr:hypothetical protein M501DRAFT_957828 [Patellaria atrata CBS 101060]